MHVAIRTAALVLLVAAAVVPPVRGQSPRADAVVATVGGEPILAGEVERLLAEVTGGRKTNPAVLPRMRAQVLAGIVDRRLVLAYARRTHSGATPEQVQAATAALKSKLESERRSLDGFLQERSLSQADLAREIAWDLTWKDFLGRYLTDERVAAYFKDHRREFDGTEVSVSHILLRPEGPGGPEAQAALVRRAQQIREEIASGKISFEDAAKKHSAGPSRAQGGRLGFIARHGAMSEAFSRAAFALETGQISPPVESQFGVHLIRADEIKSGTKQPADARKELESALAKELLEKLASLERRQTPVVFTGAMPYFKPGTQELVGPK